MKAKRHDLKAKLTVACALVCSLVLLACDETSEAADPDSTSGDDMSTGDLQFDSGSQQETLPDMAVEQSSLFERGPLPVGYVTVTFAYESPVTERSRRLIVQAWYPAPDDNDADEATYRLANVLAIDSGNALDAPPLRSGLNWPVAVYSHGSGGEGLLAYPFAELMASWGWIVLAPDHAGNTTTDFVTSDDLSLFEVAVLRPQDISALLDAAEGGFADSPLSEPIDLDQLFMFGHSFGAYTTLAIGGAKADFDAYVEACSFFSEDDCDILEKPAVEAAFRAGFRDPRVDAIGVQAPAFVPLFESGAIAGIDIPVMLQSGDLDQTTPNASQSDPVWAALDGSDDIRVQMPTGAHFTFITICHDIDSDMLLTIRPDAATDGCGEQFIDTEIAVPVLGAYLHGFARAQVLQESDWQSVLEGQAFEEGFEISSK
ncbi:MAG: hypothetical protein KC561_07015 [Myxococcales bacterium]|nr:hypothetical protein [Myxococcales bacterium]